MKSVLAILALLTIAGARPAVVTILEPAELDRHLVKLNRSVMMAQSPLSPHEAHLAPRRWPKSMLTEGAWSALDANHEVLHYDAEMGSSKYLDVYVYRWRFEKVNVRMVESTSTIVIDLPLKAFQTGEAWKAFMDKLVNTRGQRFGEHDSSTVEYHMDVVAPATWTEGARVTWRLPEGTHWLPSWTDRMEVVCDGSRVRTVLYKRRANAKGFPPGPTTWLEGILVGEERSKNYGKKHPDRAKEFLDRARTTGRHLPEYFREWLEGEGP